jgi:hypothetical protein
MVCTRQGTTIDLLWILSRVERMIWQEHMNTVHCFPKKSFLYQIYHQRSIQGGCYATGLTQVNTLVTQTKYRRKDGVCSRFNSHFSGCRVNVTRIFRSRGLRPASIVHSRKGEYVINYTQVQNLSLSKIGSIDTFITHRPYQFYCLWIFSANNTIYILGCSRADALEHSHEQSPPGDWRGIIDYRLDFWGNIRASRQGSCGPHTGRYIMIIDLGGTSRGNQVSTSYM